MIKSFGILYAGHIDADNIGIEGTPANERWFSNQQLSNAFGTALELAQLADRLGYDILWLAEHHFQREGYECIPNIALLSVHLAAHTKRVKFGCAFNILPAWHPLRLAEDFATADILTEGRVIFGIGRGYHTREVETLGAPLLDSDANRDLFEEQVEIIIKSFNQESFSHQGNYYTIPPGVPYRGYKLEEVTLVPRPAHLPVEIWQPIVSGSPRGLKFMFRHGIKGVVSGVSSATVEQTFRAYQNVGAQEGQILQLGENLALGLRFFLGDSPEKAIDAARPFYEEGFKFSGPLGFSPGLSEEQKKAAVNPKLKGRSFFPSLEEEVQDGTWICGPADVAIAALKEVEKKYPGLEHVFVNVGVGTHKKVFLEQLERFAREVMPVFMGANRATLI